MGCAQTSPPVIPYNHLPIERIYVDTVHPVVAAPPSRVPPVPFHVKGVLKKPHSHGRGRSEPLAMLRPKPIKKMRSVNFDETVSVKPRTPTPDKIWYEKASSTMPMRKHRRNDDDETASLSSDEGSTDYASGQSNHSIYQPDSLHHESQPNAMLEHDFSLTSAPQAPSNFDTYTTDRSHASLASRIKVRRRLPNLGPPQVIPTHPYQLPPQTSTQQITAPRFRTSVVSSYRPPILHPLIHVPTASSSQPVTLQHPSRLLASSIPSTSTTLLNQSSIPPPTVYSSVPLIQNTATSLNASLKQQPSLPLTPASQVK